MTDNIDAPDVLATVARYRPEQLMSEWSAAHADATLLAVLGTQPADGRAADRRPASEIPLQIVSPRSATRHRVVSRVLPVAASVAVLAAGLLAAAVLGRGGSGGDQAASGQPFGPRFTPPAGLSNHAIGKHQYSYRLTDQFDVDPAGHANRRGKYRPDAMVMRDYIGPDGTGISIRTGDQHGCLRMTGRAKTAASVALFASMPTDVNRLNRYLRTRAQGSSSKDAAVFSEVGDLLFDDGLASPRLRAAMLAVLSQTPGVRLHFGVHDFLGRKAIRADFVDPPREGPHIQSLYFDPTDFHLLESRDSNDDTPWTGAVPTPAYRAAPPTTPDDPNHLIGQSLVELNRVSRVVTHLPECH